MQRFARTITLFRTRRLFSTAARQSKSIAAASRSSPSCNGDSRENPTRHARAERQTSQLARRPSRVTMGTLLKRTQAIKSLLQLLNAINAWDKVQTPLAIAGLQLHLSHYAVSEAIRCCRCADIALCFFYWLIKRENSDMTSYVYTAIIYRLGKACRFEDMEEIATLALRNSKASAVTFAAMMSAYRRVNDLDGIVRAWHTMCNQGVQPSSSSFTLMIDAYGRMKMYAQAGDCFYQLMQSNAGPTIKTCSVLIYHLVEAGKLDAAREIFDNLTKIKVRANSVTYAYLMMGYARAGDMNTVLGLIRDFQEYGHSPYDLGESFKSVLHYLVKEGKIHEATRVLEVGWPDASSDKIEAKIGDLTRQSVGNVMPVDEDWNADSGSSNGDRYHDEDSKDVSDSFGHPPGPDANMTSNILAFVKCLHEWNSGTLRALEQANIPWDCKLVSEVLDRVIWVVPAWKFYRWVAKKPGYLHDRYTCANMLRKLLRVGQLSSAWNLWHKAEKENMILPFKSYLNLFKHCGLRKQPNFAIEVFENLKISGLELDELFYRTYIHTLYSCGRYWRLATACADMRRAGFSLDQTTYSFLISGFLRAGKLDIARRLSNQMRAAGFCPDVHMLTDLVKFLHSCGKSEKAERVFRGMQECGMHSSVHLYEVMTEILSSLDRMGEADEIKQEIKALSKGRSKSKIAREKVLMNFHSIFVNSFKEYPTEQEMVAAA